MQGIRLTNTKERNDKSNKIGMEKWEWDWGGFFSPQLYLKMHYMISDLRRG